MSMGERRKIVDNARTKDSGITVVEHHHDGSQATYNLTGTKRQNNDIFDQEID
jgi:hypothetical protein